jgi:hypothetical protein
MITLAEAPGGGGGVLGGLNTSANNSGINFSVAAAGDRALTSGTHLNSGWGAGNTYGDLVGTFNVVTGEWTCPANGYYDITTLFTLSAEVSPFDALTSGTNPFGFMGNGAAPVSTYIIAATPQTLDFTDYFGSFTVGITNDAQTIVYCGNSYLVTYNTSQIVISASYNGRRLTAGTILRFVYLNKCKNAIIGNLGNSSHLSITHLI